MDKWTKLEKRKGNDKNSFEIYRGKFEKIWKKKKWTHNFLHNFNEPKELTVSSYHDPYHCNHNSIPSPTNAQFKKPVETVFETLLLCVCVSSSHVLSRLDDHFETWKRRGWFQKRNKCHFTIARIFRICFWKFRKKKDVSVISIEQSSLRMVGAKFKNSPSLPCQKRNPPFVSKSHSSFLITPIVCYLYSNQPEVDSERVCGNVEN